MTIILAYTPNPSGDAAASFAAEEASAHKTNVVVVNSSRGGALGDPHLASKEQLDELRGRFEKVGVECTVEQPVRGKDADEETLDAADRYDARMIVLGTRRRSSVGKFILGSAAQRIIMDAEIPVVAVKPSKSGE